jgi:hypothetical protein
MAAHPPYQRRRPVVNFVDNLPPVHGLERPPFPGDRVTDDDEIPGDDESEELDGSGIDQPAPFDPVSPATAGPVPAPRNDSGEVMFIDDRVLHEVMRRHGQPVPAPSQPAPRPRPRPPQKPPSMILENFHVMDGVETTNRIRAEISRNVPHIYASPGANKNPAQKARLDEILESLETKWLKQKVIEYQVPRGVTFIRSPVIHDVDVIDAKNANISTSFIAPMIRGTMVVIARGKKDIEFYTTTSTGIIDANIAILGSIESIIDQIATIDQFSILAGIITKENGMDTFVIFDCLNLGGMNVTNQPYSYRLQRVHAIVSMFPDDGISVIPIHVDPGKFLDERKRDKQPFFSINPEHVHGGPDPLITVVKFRDEKDGMPGNDIVARWDIPEDPGTTTPAVPAPVPSPMPTSSLQIKGKTVCVTGAVPRTTKDFLKLRVKELGGTWVEVVSQNVDYLFTGGNPSTGMIDLANKYNVPVIPVVELVAMIDKSKNIGL